MIFRSSKYLFVLLLATFNAFAQDYVYIGDFIKISWYHGGASRQIRPITDVCSGNSIPTFENLGKLSKDAELRFKIFEKRRVTHCGINLEVDFTGDPIDRNSWMGYESKWKLRGRDANGATVNDEQPVTEKIRILQVSNYDSLEIGDLSDTLKEFFARIPDTQLCFQIQPTPIAKNAESDTDKKDKANRSPTEITTENVSTFSTQDLKKTKVQLAKKISPQLLFPIPRENSIAFLIDSSRSVRNTIGKTNYLDLLADQIPKILDSLNATQRFSFSTFGPIQEVWRKGRLQLATEANVEAAKKYVILLQERISKTAGPGGEYIGKAFNDLEAPQVALVLSDGEISYKLKPNEDSIPGFGSEELKNFSNREAEVDAQIQMAIDYVKKHHIKVYARQISGKMIPKATSSISPIASENSRIYGAVFMKHLSQFNNGKFLNGPINEKPDFTLLKAISDELKKRE